ncbi:MAG: universal stress protein [Acidimicrobiales bacterium]
MKFDTILVAVDMSEQSDRAVAAAEDLARTGGGRLHIVHVKERELISGKGGGVYDIEDATEAEELLARDVQRVRSDGLDATTEVRTAIAGQVPEEILASAKEHDADVVVLGSHGRSGFARVVFGGTAYKVLHLADLPVLVVR